MRGLKGGASILVAAMVCGGLDGVARGQTVEVTQPAAAPQTTTVVTQPEAPPPQTTVVTQPAPAPAVVTTTRVEGRPRYGLVGGGIALFAVPYLVTVITAAVVSDVCNADSSLGCTSARWPIYIPVIGPFIQMGYVNGNGSNTARALLGIDGGLQAAGVAMFVTGVVLRATAPRAALAMSKVNLTPYSVGSGAGLMAMGHF